MPALPSLSNMLFVAGSATLAAAEVAVAGCGLLTSVAVAEVDGVEAGAAAPVPHPVRASRDSAAPAASRESFVDIRFLEFLPGPGAQQKADLPRGRPAREGHPRDEGG